MAPTSFATTSQMETRSGGVIAASTPGLQIELDAATRAIRNYCAWHIAEREDIRWRKVRRIPGEVWLPAMEVEAITACTIDGFDAIAAGTDIEFDPETGWTNLWGRSLDITFTAGYPDIPPDLITLCIEMAAGPLVAELGLEKEQAGSVSVTYARPSNVVSPADFPRLAAYKLGAIA